MDREPVVPKSVAGKWSALATLAKICDLLMVFQMCENLRVLGARISQTACELRKASYLMSVL